MRAGRIEQLDTPAAGVRGAGHRVRRRVHRHVEPARRSRRTATAGRPATSRSPATCRSPREHAEVAVRLRPDDVQLVPDAEASACRPAAVGLPGAGGRRAVRRPAHGRGGHRRRHRAAAPRRRWPRTPGSGTLTPGRAGHRLVRRRRRRSTSTRAASASPGTCRPRQWELTWLSPSALAAPAALTRARRLLPRARALAFLGGDRLSGRRCRWCGLQRLAFEDGARGYRDRLRPPEMAETLRTTVGLGARLAGHRPGPRHAAGLGRDPAAAAAAVAARLPILPDRRAGGGGVTGWAFLFSPRPGYLNALLRTCPGGTHLDEGPVDIYSLPWIVVITGLRADRLRLPVRQRRLRQHQRRTDRGGAGERLLGGRRVLPGHPAAAAPDPGVRRLSSPCCSGLGQFTGPLLLGRTAGISVLTTDMYVAVSQSPIDYGRGRGDRLAAAAVRHRRRGRRPEAAPGRPQPVRHPRRQGVPTRGAAVQAGGWPASSPTAWSRLVLPLCALVIVSLSPFWSGDDRRRAVHAGELPQGLRRVRASPTRSSNSLTVSLASPWRSRCRSGSSRRSCCSAAPLPGDPGGHRLHRLDAARHTGGDLRRRLPAHVHARALRPLRHARG